MGMNVSAGAIPLTEVEPKGDRKLSNWLESVGEALPCWSVTSKWRWAFDRSSDTLSKCESSTVITSWSVGSKLGSMMWHSLKGIKLHEEGAVSHLSKLGGGSWSITRGRWEEEGVTVRCLSTRHQTYRILMGRKAKKRWSWKEEL